MPKYSNGYKSIDTEGKSAEELVTLLLEAQGFREVAPPPDRAKIREYLNAKFILEQVEEAYLAIDGVEYLVYGADKDATVGDALYVYAPDETGEDPTYTFKVNIEIGD